MLQWRGPNCATRFSIHGGRDVYARAASKPPKEGYGILRGRPAVAYGVAADGFFFAKSPAFTTLILFQSRRRRRAATMSWGESAAIFCSSCASNVSVRLANREDARFEASSRSCARLS